MDPRVRESIYTTFGPDEKHPDKRIKAGHPAQSRTTPDTETITVAEKQVRAANDFAQWGRNVLGTDAATRRHFEGIQPVRPGSDMLLANGARQRYSAAVSDYEATHDGSTMYESAASQSMRDRHQDDEPVGKLGHPLGFAFDIQATSNPNLIDTRDGYDLNKYMLEKFGADPGDPSARGRATMDRKSERGHEDSLEKRIERMGKHSTLDASDQATLEKVRREYTEMRQTSDNFKGSLEPENIAKLAAGRDTYHELLKVKDELARSPGDIRLRTSFENLQLDVKDGLEDGFRPWKDNLSSQSADAARLAAEKQLDIDSLTSGQKTLGGLDDDGLGAFAAAHGFTSQSDFEAAKASAHGNPRKASAQTYRDSLKEQLDARRNADRTTIHEQHDVENVNDALARKLADPARVYGGERQKDGSYATIPAVSNVPVLQLLEVGFANDSVAPSANASGLIATHDVDTVTALARRGFSPGATFGDTMHFDYIQGYNEEVIGGRNNRSTFGPNGVKTPRKQH